MITVLITGVGGGVAQSVIRALRLSNLDLRIIGTDISAEAVGFYSLDKCYITVPYTDASYVNNILSICINEGVHLVIPGLDPEVVLLSQAKDKFADKNIKVVAGSLKSVSICRNKLETYRFYKSRNMPFVKTYSSEEVLNDASLLEYPLFIKPLAGSASRGAEVIFSQDALIRSLKANPDLIVQEFLVPERWNVDKQSITQEDVRRGNLLRQEEELAVGCYVSGKGEILSAYLAIFELSNGVLQYAKPFVNAEITGIAEGMIHELCKEGLVGPINFQGRITKEGAVFYEINPRFTGGSAMSAGFGFNHCRSAVEDFVLGLPTQEIRSKLNVNYGVLCKRYITEMIIENECYDELRLNKTAEPRNSRSLIL